MEKVIRDGMVAVLYSTGYGVGWSTVSARCGDGSKLLFDPQIVAMVEDKVNYNKIKQYCEKNYPNFYPGGALGLMVCWLPVGTQFIVREYDGSEWIEIKEEINWIEA